RRRDQKARFVAATSFLQRSARRAAGWLRRHDHARIDRWYRELERAPHTRHAVHADGSPVRLHDSPCDRQPEPETAPVRVARLPEPAEDVWQLLCRYAVPRVGHAETHYALGLPCRPPPR